MNAQARSSLQGFLALLVALTLTFSPSISIQPAAAQAGVEIPVTTTADVIADDSACSLREAVLAANSDSPVGGCPAGSGADTILLPAGTYTLALPGRTEDDGRTGDLDIHADLTLRGAGADLTVIDGARLDRILQVHAGQVLIAGLALTNGQAGEHSQEEREPGGAVHNAGTLTLEDVLVTRNFNENMLGYAGGLFNSGSLTLLRSRVVDNWTEHEGGGGGIWNEGELLVEDSLLDQNHSYTAAALLNVDNGTAVLRRTRVTNSGGCFERGAISNYGRLEIDQSDINHNDCEPSGALYSQGELIITGTRLDHNTSLFGWAFELSGQAEIRDSSFTRNAGALRWKSGSLLLANTTITGSGHPDGTGALLVEGGTVDLVHASLLLNQRALTLAGGETRLANSLLAGSRSEQDPAADLQLSGGSLVSLGGNLVDIIGETGFPDGEGDQFGTPAAPLDPLVGPLTPGGRTDYFPLLPGSPAIDRGREENCLPADQLGALRPADGDGDGQAACDVGAVEAPGIQQNPGQDPTPGPLPDPTQPPAPEPPPTGGDDRMRIYLPMLSAG